MGRTAGALAQESAPSSALLCSPGPATWLLGTAVAASVERGQPSLWSVAIILCDSLVALSCVFPSPPTLGKQRSISSYRTLHSSWIPELHPMCCVLVGGSGLGAKEGTTAPSEVSAQGGEARGLRHQEFYLHLQQQRPESRRNINSFGLQSQNCKTKNPICLEQNF